MSIFPVEKNGSKTATSMIIFMYVRQKSKIRLQLEYEQIKLRISKIFIRNAYFYIISRKIILTENNNTKYMLKKII